MAEVSDMGGLSERKKNGADRGPNMPPADQDGAKGAGAGGATATLWLERRGAILSHRRGNNPDPWAVVDALLAQEIRDCFLSAGLCALFSICKQSPLFCPILIP